MPSPSPAPASRNDPAALRAIARSRLSDEVAARIRRYIRENGLGPGDRLPSERDLAAKLATSRATVSQALRSLSVAGLVVVRHGSGAYVCTDPAHVVGINVDLSVEEGTLHDREVAEFMHWIELALVAAPKPPEFDHRAIARTYAALEQAGDTVADFVQADAAFHRAVIRGTRNRYLVALFEELHREIHRLTYSGWVESGETPGWLRGVDFQRQLELHRRIRDTALAGDLGALKTALDEHDRAVLAHLSQR